MPRGGQEPRRRARRIRVAQFRLVCADRDVLGHDPGEETGDLGRLDDPRRDADPLLHLDVGAHMGRQGFGHELHEPGPDEAAVTGSDQLLPRSEIRERGPREACVALEVVVHPHEPRRSSGRPGGDVLALEDQDPRPAPRQVEGETGALHPGAHDDDVGRLDHAPIMRVCRSVVSITDEPGAGHIGTHGTCRARDTD